MDYAQAIILGLIQGVTELFPVSSLGHSVILPAAVRLDERRRGAVGPGVVLPGLPGRSPRRHGAGPRLLLPRPMGAHRPGADPLAATPPDRDVRRTPGLAARRGHDPGRHRRPCASSIPCASCSRHPSRRPGSSSSTASSCSPVSGSAGAREVRAVVAAHEQTAAGDRRLDTLEFREAGVVGVAQVFALLAGISRSGITMVAGLVRGLDHEDAARFSFLLATPIILAAGRLQAAGPARPQRRRRPRPGAGGQHRGRDRGLRVRALPESLLHHADADAVRGLLARGRVARACPVWPVARERVEFSQPLICHSNRCGLALLRLLTQP